MTDSANGIIAFHQCGKRNPRIAIGAGNAAIIISAEPKLEIYADDVKCSHGATVGRIDEEQLFYLRSRGIEQQAAQQMILYAFAAELTEAIRSDALREQVLARIGQRLPGGTV